VRAMRSFRMYFLSHRRILPWFVFFIRLAFMPLQGQAEPPDPANWRLTFGEEFEASTLDLNRWMTTYSDGGRTLSGNQEAEYYADDAFEFQNGILRIRAEKRSMGGFNYTSGVITSYRSFRQQYGYFEIRAKMPKGKGFWPAFWLLPMDRWPPEIDVLEVLGHQTDVVYLTNHWGADWQHHQSQGQWFQGPDFGSDFHLFGIDWEPDVIIWYVDGVERFRSYIGVPQEPMYLIANLAVGGSWPGYPDSTTPFPSYFEIDYIRGYERIAPRPVSLDEPMTLRANSNGASVAEYAWSNGVAGFFKNNIAFHFLRGTDGGRGLNVAVLDPRSGEPLVPIRSFDLYGGGGLVAAELVKFLSDQPTGAVLLMAIADDAGLNLGTGCALKTESWVATVFQALEDLGSRLVRHYCYRNSWSMIAVKGEGRARQEAWKSGEEARTQTRILTWNRPEWIRRTR
jgi:beta-glucanase (GH16 family)